MEFCRECGKKLKIYKKRFKQEYYFRCKNCRISFPIEDKVIIVKSSSRKNAKKRRTLLGNLRKIQNKGGAVAVG